VEHELHRHRVFYPSTASGLFSALVTTEYFREYDPLVFEQLLMCACVKLQRSRGQHGELNGCRLGPRVGLLVEDLL
jgi:hypothetical protein